MFITDQAAASEEPEAPKDREEIQRELARRGVSMPNIILPGMRGGEVCVVRAWCLVCGACVAQESNLVCLYMLTVYL